MGTRMLYCLNTLVFLDLLLCSGKILRERENETHIKKEVPFNRKLMGSKPATSLLDVVTPLTTAPVINPATITATPIANPASTATSNPLAPVTGPNTTPMTRAPTMFSGQSWCIASLAASRAALQVALDYACGFGGTDCSAILAGSSCYNPDTVQDHASYAFNSYYQRNPVPSSCDFGGTAVLTNIDPSTANCRFPSTSTTSSVLNISNPSGSRVFGTVPPNSNGGIPKLVSPRFLQACILMTVLIINRV